MAEVRERLDAVKTLDSKVLLALKDRADEADAVFTEATAQAAKAEAEVGAGAAEVAAGLAALEGAFDSKLNELTAKLYAEVRCTRFSRFATPLIVAARPGP